MTNVETIKQYLEEVKPTDCNFSINYKWMMRHLQMIIDADKQDVLINPEYLRAPISITFDGTMNNEPPVFDTWSKE